MNKLAVKVSLNRLQLLQNADDAAQIQIPPGEGKLPDSGNAERGVGAGAATRLPAEPSSGTCDKAAPRSPPQPSRTNAPAKRAPSPSHGFAQGFAILCSLCQ